MDANAVLLRVPFLPLADCLGNLCYMIRIAHALNDINERSSGDGGEPFSIEFVTNEGKVRRVKRALRGARDYKAPKAGNENVSKSKFNQKEKGMLNILDLDAGGIKSVTIACILRYNGTEVFH